MEIIIEKQWYISYIVPDSHLCYYCNDISILYLKDIRTKIFGGIKDMTWTKHINEALVFSSKKASKTIIKIWGHGDLYIQEHFRKHVSIKKLKVFDNVKPFGFLDFLGKGE